MMQYDFQTVINRTNTGSAKWEQMKGWNPNLSENIVPFSVADMELKNAPEIVEGLKKYIDSTTLGYTMPTEGYLDAVCSWMKKRHNWEINPEWIVGSAGVVSAFYLTIKAFSNPGDGIIIMTPVYYPFYHSIEKNNRKLVKNPLINDGSTYVIDYEELEKKTQNPNNKILLFCSPHNPTGRVWSREELEKIGEICLRNNVLIISDEIYFDLIMPGYKHTVFASISEKLSNNMVVCTAPSKTFNLAGMQASNIIIPNKELRDGYLKEVESNGFFYLSILGYKACEIAYTECEAWLDELIKLIYHNHLQLKKYIEENIPVIKVYDLEGTYLQWMDFNGLGLNKEELEKLMHEEAMLFFDEGYLFGEEGNGYERMNIACPTKVMMDGLVRLRETLSLNVLNLDLYEP
ncbi:MAG: MalY/PatB family protein [Clostridium sp.]|uniref:MalY/PatB family protein n=1 Tax=Clostridium sp. TaxID=1506 RepID=UPI003D6DA3EC